MTRGVKQGVLTTKDLRERLGISDEEKPDKDKKKKKKTKKEEEKKEGFCDLLLKAKELKLITDKEYEDSIPRKESVIKCYLYSVITDQNVRDIIDKYVVIASQFYIRASFMANILANKYLGQTISIDVKKSTYPFIDLDLIEYIEPLYNIVNSEDFKHFFLYERWERGGKDLFREVSNILTEYRDILEPFTPIDWLSIMSVSGWDNCINRMHSKYMVNIKNHVTVNMSNVFKKYFKNIDINKQFSDAKEAKNYRHQLFQLLTKPIDSDSKDKFNTIDYEYVISLRKYFDVKDDEFMSWDIDYSKKSFCIFMLLTRYGITNSTYLPVAKIERKYCYIDIKIARFMFPKLYKEKKIGDQEPLLSEIFDINPSEYNKRRRALRKTLRKEGKKKSKWRKIGASNMPKDAEISSFETDGVGLSICIKRKIQMPTKIKKVVTTEETKSLANKVVMGGDGGRAKIMTVAVSKKGIKKPVTFFFTKKQYYYEIKHKVRIKINQEHTRSNNMESINYILSLNNGKKSFLTYLERLSALYNNGIKQFSLVDKHFAMWRMRTYRFKVRSKDSAVQRLFNMSGNKDIVFGIGNAKFASTGKGEKAVPTTSFNKAILKAKRRLEINKQPDEAEHGKKKKKKRKRLRKKKRKKQIEILSVSEINTTKCCCACCSETKSPYIPRTGYYSARLRLCHGCGSSKGPKLRDRDIQAARNILWCTQLQYIGLDRPEYLQLKKKEAEAEVTVSNEASGSGQQTTDIQPVKKIKVKLKNM
jgi:hypothetical protein